ncbi:MAG: D-alanine--D-alanine ligase [Alphaproteobacteria bacterium]|nr:D-alanine--D-alanine ligase [Alphaproteobacteria bacterium]
MTIRKKIAVFIGGRSPEHDVSVVSGLQAFAALDRRKYDPFIVYIAPDGVWFTGKDLEKRENYIPEGHARDKLTRVVLDTNNSRDPCLMPEKRGLFAGGPLYFDIALPVFHGLHGEDGAFQGLLEMANVPYTGMRLKASAVFMDKATTKDALTSCNIPMLPYVSVTRPALGYLVEENLLQQKVKEIGYPCCVKPANLGSSIGVGKATNLEEVRALLARVFQYDSKAIIEPFVQHLVEYNVAVRSETGKAVTSAIERPKTSAELLDFKEKYMSGGGKKGGLKTPAQSSEGMLSLTRDINPDLPAELAAQIRNIAVTVFDRLDGSGTPRIDFVGNSKTGEIWFNELNPCPGSLAYFLWERAEHPLLFTELLTKLIEEAEYHHGRKQIPADPVPQDARLLKRKN